VEERETGWRAQVHGLDAGICKLNGGNAEMCPAWRERKIAALRYEDGNIVAILVEKL
jgi:hypothetical protein